MCRNRNSEARRPDEERDDGWFEARLDDNKFVAGWKKVTWTKHQPPLNDPTFDLQELLTEVTDESYGPYRHSSELPPWGESQ